MSYGNSSYGGSTYASTSGSEIIRVDSSIRTVALSTTKNSVSQSRSIDSVTSREAVSTVTKSNEISVIEELATLSIGDATTSLNVNTFSASIDPSVRAESLNISFDLFDGDDATQTTENAIKESVLTDARFTSENSFSVEFSENSNFETVSRGGNTVSQSIDSSVLQGSISSVTDSIDSSVSTDNSGRLLSNIVSVITDEKSTGLDISSPVLASQFTLQSLEESRVLDFSESQRIISNASSSVSNTESLTIGGRVTSGVTVLLPKLLVSVSAEGNINSAVISVENSTEDSVGEEQSVLIDSNSSSRNAFEFSESETVGENQKITGVTNTVDNSLLVTKSSDIANKFTEELVTLTSDNRSETSDESIVSISDSATDISFEIGTASVDVLLSDAITNVNTVPVSSVSESQSTDSVSKTKANTNTSNSLEKSITRESGIDVNIVSSIFDSFDKTVTRDRSIAENINTSIINSFDNTVSVDASERLSVSSEQLTTFDNTRVSEDSDRSLFNTVTTKSEDITESIDTSTVTETVSDVLLPVSRSESIDSSKISSSIASIENPVLNISVGGERVSRQFELFAGVSKSQATDASSIFTASSFSNNGVESTRSFDNSVKSNIISDVRNGLSQAKSFTQSDIILSTGSILESGEETISRDDGNILDSISKSFTSQSFSRGFDNALQVQLVLESISTSDNTQTVDISDNIKIETVLDESISRSASQTETAFIQSNTSVNNTVDITSVLESDRQESAFSFVDSSNEVTTVNDVSSVSVAESQTDLSVDSTRSVEKISQRSEATSVTPVISDAELLTVSFDAVRSSTGSFNSFDTVSKSSSIDTSVISPLTSSIDIPVSSAIVFDDVSIESAESDSIDSTDVGRVTDSVNAVELLAELGLSISNSTSLSVNNQRYDVDTNSTNSSDVTESIDESNESLVIALSSNSFSRSSSRTNAGKYVSIATGVDSVTRSVAADISSFILSLSESSDGVSKSVSVDESINSSSASSLLQAADSARSIDESVLSDFVTEGFVSDETSLAVDISVLSTSVSPAEISLETAVAFVNSVDNASIASVVFEPARSTSTSSVFIDGVLVGTASPFNNIDTFTFTQDESIDISVESVELNSESRASSLDVSRRSLLTPFSERIGVLTEAVAEGTVFVVGSNIVVLTNDDIFFVVTSTSDGESNVKVLQASNTSVSVENVQNNVRILNE